MIAKDPSFEAATVIRFSKSTALSWGSRRAWPGEDRRIRIPSFGSRQPISGIHFREGILADILKTLTIIAIIWLSSPSKTWVGLPHLEASTNATSIYLDCPDSCPPHKWFCCPARCCSSNAGIATWWASPRPPPKWLLDCWFNKNDAYGWDESWTFKCWCLGDFRIFRHVSSPFDNMIEWRSDCQNLQRTWRNPSSWSWGHRAIPNSFESWFPWRKMRQVRRIFHLQNPHRNTLFCSHLCKHSFPERVWWAKRWDELISNAVL